MLACITPPPLLSSAKNGPFNPSEEIRVNVEILSATKLNKSYFFPGTSHSFPRALFCFKNAPLPF